jgi:predicted acylesterase/phospholipase RssA
MGIYQSSGTTLSQINREGITIENVQMQKRTDPSIISLSTSGVAAVNAGINPVNITKQVALVLSGGGAHGDFEIGVVNYLYRVRKINPKIICGTSVGAINALKLAEGEPKDGIAKREPDGHLQGLAGLEEIWNSLQKNGDMWKNAVDISNFEDDAKELLADVAATAISSVLLGPIGLIAWLFSGGDDAVDKIKKDIQSLLGTRSLYNLDPIYQTMLLRKSFHPELIATSGIKLRLAMVALEDGKLRYVTESGAVLERDGSPTLFTQYDAACSGPLLQKIAEIDAQIKDAQDSAFDDKDPQKGALAGVAALRNKQNQLRKQLENCPKKQFPVTTNLVTGALASSSIPFVFPPVRVGAYWYIDGGVRATTPIESAIIAGGDFIYAVVASSPDLDPEKPILGGGGPLDSYDPPANILDIGKRAAEDIMPSEIAEDSLFPPNSWGKPVVVIRPEYDIHDGMTIDPGLVRIRIDHGFMRADDVMTAWDKDPSSYREQTMKNSDVRNTTRIVRLRRKIWKLEYAANGFQYHSDPGPHPEKPSPLAGADSVNKSVEALASVRHWKRELKELVDQRIASGGKMPPGYESWWLGWEQHPWKSVIALWDANNPFVPLKTMNVTVNPQKLAVNKPVQFTITATYNGSTVAAKVLSDGKVIGQTGQVINYKFDTKTQTEFDPETKHKDTEIIAPVVSVIAAGYRTVYPDMFGGL